MAQTDEYEQIAAQLEATGNYKVIRKLPERKVYRDYDGGPTKIGVILDSETTGLNVDTDRVIEIALVVFEYNPETGVVYRITEAYDELEDPGIPIPPSATAKNNITDEMVRGKKIDDEIVRRIASAADLVIAHNASFDRPVVERRFPVFEHVDWACSVDDIPWKDLGFASGSLEFLAYKSNFYYEAHRAEADCRALLEVLAADDGEGHPNLKRILDVSRIPSLRLWALDSPYDSREALKARGYRWASVSRLWWITLPKTAAKAEAEWLLSTVYGGRPAKIRVDTIVAKDRFTTRGKQQQYDLAKLIQA